MSKLQVPDVESYDKLEFGKFEFEFGRTNEERAEILGYSLLKSAKD